MFLTLDINNLNPHQVTSVLGLTMQKDLALIPTVKYRIDNNHSLSMECYCLYRFMKQVNVSRFYDNGGRDVHQSNGTVREFYLHLSDSKLQNAATATAHIHTLLAKVFD